MRGMGCGQELEMSYELMGDEVLLTTIIEDASGQLIFDLVIMGK